MYSTEKGTQMSTNPTKYLEELGALLEEHFDEEVYTSTLVAEGKTYLRGSLDDLFFATQYDPKLPVKVLADNIIKKIERERKRKRAD